MKDKRARNEAITQGGEEKFSKLKLHCVALFNMFIKFSVYCGSASFDFESLYKFI